MTTNATESRQEEFKAAAKTIFDQLGGGAFKAMTGAKNFTFSSTAEHPNFCFMLPARFAQHGINHVNIVLDPSDTYTMVFSKWVNPTMKNGYRTSRTEIKSVSGLYAEMLAPTFREVTGLEVRMPRFI